MQSERMKILDLLGEHRISSDEAEWLLTRAGRKDRALLWVAWAVVQVILLSAFLSHPRVDAYFNRVLLSPQPIAKNAPPLKPVEIWVNRFLRVLL